MTAVIMTTADNPHAEDDTTYAPTAMAEPAAVAELAEAWSTEIDVTPPQRRSWRDVAALVAGVTMVAAAVVGAVVVFKTHHHPDAAVAMSRTAAPPTKQVDPYREKPWPPADVLHSGDADSHYLATLLNEAHIRFDHPPDAIDYGHHLCDYLIDHSNAETIRSVEMVNLLDDNTHPTPTQANLWMHAAITEYCPNFQNRP